LALQERELGLLSRPLTETAGELAAVYQQTGQALRAQALERWVVYVQELGGRRSDVDAAQARLPSERGGG
jgi:hypothetical protein